MHEPQEGDEEFVYDDDADYEDEDDGDFIAGVVVTAEGEPGLDKIRANTTWKAAYEAGAPVTPGQVAKRTARSSLKTNRLRVTVQAFEWKLR